MKLSIISSVGSKLIGGFLVVVAMSVLIGGISFNQFRSTERLVEDEVMGKSDARHLSAQIILKSSLVFGLVNDYLLTSQESKRASLRVIINDQIQTLGEYSRQVKNRKLTINEKEIFDKIENLLFRYNSLIKKVLEEKSEIEIKKVVDEFREVHSRFITLLQNFDSIETKMMYDSWDLARGKFRTITMLILLLSAGALILGIFFGIISTRMITVPIGKLTNILEDMSQGDMTGKMDIARSDEFGKAAASCNRLVDYLQEVVSVCKGIAVGDHDHSIRIRGGDDLLGQSITLMTRTLREVTQEQETQSRLKTGQMELNTRIRGEQDVATLAQNIISYLADYLNAKVGAIYSVNEENLLKLTGTYAYTKRKNLSGEYKFGDGLVGQAALEKKEILITNVPDDYITINSGLGEAVPHNILVMPFLYEGKTKGVIELGSFEGFTDIQLNFLKSVVENVAIAFNTAQSRFQMKELLEKTQAQSEELQAQQEELMASNSELEAHTKLLKTSEATLQAQQEELRQSNEELEEKGHVLEEQRKNLEKNNVELGKVQAIIKEQMTELELSSKYKSEFLANMSHELRTPLNSLLILSNLLTQNKEGNLSEKEVEFAKTINSAGSDLLSLINEILDLSKIEAGKMELNIGDIALTDMAGHMERSFGHIAKGKGLTLNTNLGDGLPEFIRSDRQRVEQIIKNLLSNALKFTNKGGITITICRPGTAVGLSLRTLNPQEAVAIAVSDTGKGIAKDKQRVIFEAFQQEDGTTSRKFGGTGLGLSISRELAKLLGGEIHLESEEGKGSTFTIYLPETLKTKKDVRESPKPDTKIIRAEKLPASAAQTQKPKPGPNRGEKPPVSQPIPSDMNAIRDDRKIIAPDDKSILIIEDDPKFAKILFDLAHKKEFKCLIAGNGETGLHFADYYRPSAIILDIGLPGIDGWHVMERLKENPDTRHIPVHFMSASDKAAAAIKTGAIGYLVKPVSMEQIEEAFKKIEGAILKPVTKLLIVKADSMERNNIVKLIDSKDIETVAVGTGEEAYNLLRSDTFDCMVVGFDLPDISVFELLEKIRKDKVISHLPTIVYTIKELSEEEETTLKQYAESIIIKGKKSQERLLDETSLFLHRVEADMPEKKRKTLKLTHDKDMILKDKKILVVDDDMRNVFALTSIFEGKGMKVLAGKNGKEGLDKLNNNPDIDLILMDIMMPEMDGYEAMGKIRKEVQFAKLPIIALTAKAMKGDRDKCIEAGASDYLAKPVEMDKLLSLLRVWLYNR